MRSSRSGVFFNFAIDGQFITSNPAVSIRLRKHTKELVCRFSPRERTNILANLSGSSLLYFSLFFGCGMRPGELRGLRWSDWDGERLYVRRSIVCRKLKSGTKNHENRKVYVPEWVRSLLVNHST